MIPIKVNAVQACASSAMFESAIVRALSAVLLFKVMALICLYALFFGPSHRAPADVRALFEGSIPARIAPR